MLRRAIEERIISSLRQFPVVGIVGPRQVGKTTLAKSIARRRKATTYLDLELPSDVAKLEEAELYLRGHSRSLVILDEIQRMPGLFPLIRALVDESPRRGRFLVLGSASPSLARQSAESLAGRLDYHELTPFTLPETAGEESDYGNLWTRGGYPRSYLAESADASLRWRLAFIQTHLERDLPALGVRVPATMLRRFWQMLAHAHGQLWNASKMAASLGVTPPTAQHYLDILQDTFMIRELRPYHVNLKKRLVKSPKIYLRDAGLVHALLGIRSYDDLLGHPAAGASWEGFVVEQIVSSMPPSWGSFFYRTASGAEIDLVLEPRPGRLIAIEIKRSLHPKLDRGFWSARDDLQPQKSFVVYAGSERFALRKDVLALPIFEIARIWKLRGSV
jgi:predicted AAA+ superfamily ATPase